jgi:hypothetical protein
MHLPICRDDIPLLIQVSVLPKQPIRFPKTIAPQFVNTTLAIKKIGPAIVIIIDCSVHSHKIEKGVSPVLHTVELSASAKVQHKAFGSNQILCRKPLQKRRLEIDI